jgi:3-hydroxy acid dehydrogenase/malonic semialdehyde reductase
MFYTPHTVLITGATSGFGQALAKLISEQSPQTKMILTGRRADRLEAIKNDLQSDIHIMAQDVTDFDKVKEDIANIPDEFKNIDCLINNAGLASTADEFTNVDEADLFQMIDVNVKGLVHMTHQILPGMIERKGGVIVNLGSIAGNYNYPGGHVYCGTKAFVNHFSKTLRADVKGKNIRVTSVEPGAVETEFSVVRFKGDQEKADGVYNNHRPLNANHIARTLWWIMTQPPELNVNNIEVMPTDQSYNGFSFDKFEG